MDDVRCDDVKKDPTTDDFYGFVTNLVEKEGKKAKASQTTRQPIDSKSPN
jgi:hypothetical protein